MDEDLREPVRPARWLAWAVAGLLTAGAVSAGTVSGANDAADQRIVTAAGADAFGVEVPTTVSEPEPVPTVPLVSSTTTTTEAPRPTTTTPPTTRPPRTTTTKPPASAATTPTTAAPKGTTLTVVNEHPLAVVVTVNGKTFEVAPGQRVGPAAITRSASGNDVVEVALLEERTCGTGDADRYFATPGSYLMTITPSPGLCQPGMPGPMVKVTPA